MTAAASASKILIVEDEGIVAFNLQQRLQHMGYRITGLAESGAEGLALVSRERPDLVLMDIHIKGDMDGIELARRATELDPDIKVMFITGFAAVALNPDSKAPKDAKVLSKPFHLRELVNEVEKLLAA